ncbi:winged helix-turn-helix domain-containing protein [Candidatus Pelagibacter sp. HIMB1715]|uniref:winged helix-turn-helix domain-containing protein n=1 Tax=Candidatus Pelagibacter sp. HIMB1715 TaxID=3413369 RepID=UPI003F83EF61
MKTQNIIIYRLNILYQILKELENQCNFKVIEIESVETLRDSMKNLSNYLVISNNNNLDIKFQLKLSLVPIKIFNLIEKINIEFLKNNYNHQSKIRINDYFVDLNSRELIRNKKKIKLTEKEIGSIIFIFNANKSVLIRELEEHVWKYQSAIETHTVETHIYRLRKKIYNNFKDDKFIISTKNGYKIV